jgi:hypothetical protein
MANLDGYTVARSEGKQLIGFVKGTREWLLDKNGAAIPDEVASNREVRLSRYSNAGSVDPTQEVAVVRRRGCTVCCGDVPGSLEVAIGHTQQLCLRHPSVQARVMLTEVSRANDGYTNSLLHRVITLLQKQIKRAGIPCHRRRTGVEDGVAQLPGRLRSVWVLAHR